MRRILCTQTLYCRMMNGEDAILSPSREQDDDQKMHEGIIIAFSKNKSYPITNILFGKDSNGSTSISITARGEGNREYIISHIQDLSLTMDVLIDNFKNATL